MKLRDIVKKFDIVNFFPDSLYQVPTVISFSRRGTKIAFTTSITLGLQYANNSIEIVVESMDVWVLFYLQGLLLTPIFFYLKFILRKCAENT